MWIDLIRCWSIEVCRKRAQKGGPEVVITAVMNRALLALDGKADYFFQVGKIELRGRRLAIREQTGQVSCRLEIRGWWRRRGYVDR